MIWKGIAVLLNPVVSCFDISSFEWRLANYECVDYYSQRPNVNLVRMTRLTLENFRSDIVWSATNSAFSLTIKVYLGSQPKVAHLNFHFVVDEQIAKL